MDMSRSDTMLRTHHRVCLEFQHNFKGFELDLSRRTFKGTKTAFVLLIYIYTGGKRTVKGTWSGLARSLFTI